MGVRASYWARADLDLRLFRWALVAAAVCACWPWASRLPLFAA